VKTHLEVLFAPAESAALAQRDLSSTTCVVFDILRATTAIITALAHGAKAVIPAADLAEARAWRQRDPAVLLAGERNGLRIRADLTGGVDFDLGNSPREFTPDRVAGRTIVMTTSNGTGALRAVVQAPRVLLGSFLNLGAVADWIARGRPAELLLVCGGTLAQTSFEDTLAAGALCDRVWPLYADRNPADSAHIARQMFLTNCGDLPSAMQYSRNGRRLLGHPDLRDDVPFCLQQDTLQLLASLHADGSVRTLLA